MCTSSSYDIEEGLIVLGNDALSAQGEDQLDERPIVSRLGAIDGVLNYAAFLEQENTKQHDQTEKK